MNEFYPDPVMLNQYMQNKLDSVQSEQLELWLLDHPEVLDDLEMDLMLQQGIEVPAEPAVKSSGLSFAGFFQNKRWIPVHLLAYVMLVFLSYDFFKNDSTDYSVSTFVELVKQRGTEPTVTEIRIRNNSNLVLRLFPDSLTEVHTLKMLSIPPNREIIFHDLKADDDGSITVSIENAKNIAGKWDILLLSHTNDKKQKFIISFN